MRRWLLLIPLLLLGGCVAYAPYPEQSGYAPYGYAPYGYASAPVYVAPAPTVYFGYGYSHGWGGSHGGWGGRHGGWGRGGYHR